MLGVRLDPETERALAALAKRDRRSKSDIAREAIARHVRAHDDAYLLEARRQSLLVSRTDDPAELDFWESDDLESREA